MPTSTAERPVGSVGLDVLIDEVARLSMDFLPCIISSWRPIIYGKHVLRLDIRQRASRQSI